MSDAVRDFELRSNSVVLHRDGPGNVAGDGREHDGAAPATVPRAGDHLPHRRRQVVGDAAPLPRRLASARPRRPARRGVGDDDE